MSEDRIGGPAREKFANLFKAQYDNGKELHGIDNSMSYDKYIKTLIEDGEFDHVIDTPFESVISNLLHVTLIKPLIEACTGYDMITGDNLNGTQRVFKVGMAAIDIITLGQAIGAQEGLGVLTTGVRVIGTNAVTNGTVLGVNEVADQLDLPLPIRVLLSLGAGYTVAKVAGKYLLYNSEGRVIGEYTGEIKSVGDDGCNSEISSIYSKDLNKTNLELSYVELTRIKNDVTDIIKENHTQIYGIAKEIVDEGDTLRITLKDRDVVVVLDKDTLEAEGIPKELIDCIGGNCFTAEIKVSTDAATSGKIIRFSHNPELPSYKGSFTELEWKYLQDKYGYLYLREEGGFWYGEK